MSQHLETPKAKVTGHGIVIPAGKVQTDPKAPEPKQQEPKK